MSNVIDKISLGDIVKIREQLIIAAAHGKRIYRFEAGGPSFRPISVIEDAATNAPAQPISSKYVPNAGIPNLLKTICELHNTAPFGNDELETDQVFITNGAMHGIFCVFQILLDPGDEVIIPDPMWTEISDNIILAGGIPIRVPILDENGKNTYTANNIKNKITNKTKAIFINSPHNPTGTILTNQEIIDIGFLAEDQKITVITDEAYNDIRFSPSSCVYKCFTEDADVPCPNLVQIYSFSKSYAMAGWRLGYVILDNEKAIERMHKILRCSVNGINSIAQEAGVAAIKYGRKDAEKMSEIYNLRGAYMYHALKDSQSLEPIRPNGAFYLWCKVIGKSGKAMSQYLIDNGIGCVPGTAFGPNHHEYIRLSFACDTSMVLEGTQKILDLTC